VLDVRRVALITRAAHAQRTGPDVARRCECDEHVRRSRFAQAFGVERAREQGDAQRRCAGDTHQRLAHPDARRRDIERTGEQFLRRALQALQVQFKPAHGAVAHLHRTEMTIVDQRQRAQVVDAGRPAIELHALLHQALPGLRYDARPVWPHSPNS
jgi:hypothetical protein